jgi:hypothetical protein
VPGGVGFWLNGGSCARGDACCGEATAELNSLEGAALAFGFGDFAPRAMRCPHVDHLRLQGVRAPGVQHAALVEQLADEFSFEVDVEAGVSCPGFGLAGAEVSFDVVVRWRMMAQALRKLTPLAFSAMTASMTLETSCGLSLNVSVMSCSVGALGVSPSLRMAVVRMVAQS